jgi:hypothetical protein
MVGENTVQYVGYIRPYILTTPMLGHLLVKILLSRSITDFDLQVAPQSPGNLQLLLSGTRGPR